MMDHFGKSGPAFQVFKNKVIGLEKVQNQIYQILRAFSNLGQNNRMILLHGPNGSAKSTLISSLMDGMSAYSGTPEGPSTPSRGFSDRQDYTRQPWNPW